MRLIRKIKSLHKPVLLKIAPDLSLAELEQIITTCEENNIAGIIATNTTLDHAAVPGPLDQAGGLSGLPLREKSTEFVRAITVRSRLPVIASGGIFDAAALEKNSKPALNFSRFTPDYIYRGPGLLREIAEGL